MIVKLVLSTYDLDAGSVCQGFLNNKDCIYLPLMEKSLHNLSWYPGSQTAELRVVLGHMK